MKRIYRFLSSYEFSVYLFIAGLLYYIFLFAWGLTSPKMVVNNISKTAPFIVLYVLFLINLVLCMLKRIPVILKKSTARELLIKTRTSTITISYDKVDKIKNFVKNYDELDGEKEIFILRGRFSPVADLIFHLMFVLVLSGIFTSRLTRFEGRINLPEGFNFWGEVNEYYSKPEAKEFYLRAPHLSFNVSEVGAEFYQDKLFFTDLFARLKYPPETMKDEKTVRLKTGSYFGLNHINIEGYGFAPVVILRDKKNKVIYSATVNMSIFPPTTEDYFLIPDTPLRIYLQFFPDYKKNNNTIEPATMNLVNPLFLVRIYRGKRLLFNNYLRLNEMVDIDNYKFIISGIKKTAQLRVVRDPGVLFIFAGIFIGIAGIFWRFFFPRRELSIRRMGDKIEIQFSTEFFPEIYKKLILRKLKG